MGKFEEGKAKAGLPTDVPGAAEAAREHPDGAIYTADNGKRFRLRHASWAEVKPRGENAEKKPATAKK